MTVFNCDACGRFIPYLDFETGAASRKLITPDSALSTEEYETLCKFHVSPVSIPRDDVLKVLAADLAVMEASLPFITGRYSHIPSDLIQALALAAYDVGVRQVDIARTREADSASRVSK